MKVHPRNEGTSTVDLAILVAMPVVTAILCVVIYFLAVPLTTMTGG